MKTKMEQFPAKNPNPVLSVAKDGTVLYPNEAGKPLLHEWSVELSEKLPSSILDLVQRVIYRNSPEKMEIKVGKKVYSATFHPIPEEECVNIYGFDISDQKELERKLRESEKRERARSDELEAVLDAVPAAVWITHDSKALRLTGNRLSYEWLRLPMGANMSKAAPEGERPETYRMLKDGVEIPLANMPVRMSAAGTEVHDYEFDLVYPDGVMRHLLGNARPLRDEQGNPRGAVSAFIDITERKKAEEALNKAYGNLEKLVEERTNQLEKAYKSLKESEEGLAEAQKMAHIGNWVWDIATDKAYWSDELYRIFGRSPIELAPSYNDYLSYVHPDDRDYVDNAHKKALNGKAFSTDHRIVLSDGEIRTIHMQTEVIFDDENVPIRLKGTVQDITERKGIEEQLRESEEKYRNIVETANEGIAILDSDGKVIYSNKKFEDILGYNTGESINKSAYDFIENVVAFKRKLEERRKGINDSYELKAIRKDGSTIWVNANVKTLFDEKGEYTGSLGMFTDITKRKEAEKALANIETAREKEIHHRIKNNLQVISSLLDLQAEKFSSRECIKDSEFLEAFRESQDRVISIALIHEELYKGGDTDSINFSSYIEKLANNLFLTYKLENTDITLNMSISENLFFDMDTSIPLGMIVNELISNSLKHAFQGRDKGIIQIKLHRNKSVECKNNDCMNNFFLTVSDDGIGIPENLAIENLDSLGLQLVTTLVDQLDGKLELKRDNGTEFSIRFTATEKNDQASAPVSLYTEY